jgi:hypothetical protein
MGRNYAYPPQKVLDDSVPLTPTIKDDSIGDWYEKPNWGGHRYMGMGGVRFQNIDSWAYPNSRANYESGSGHTVFANRTTHIHRINRNYRYQVIAPHSSSFFKWRW